MFITKIFPELKKYSFNIITSTLLCTLLLACEGKKPETNVQNDNSSTADIFPNVDSKHIQVIPTMHSVFNENNTVHCSNVEYLWNTLISNSDKDVSGNSLAKEFNQSQSWRNSMDTSRLVLAFGNPSNVYESIIHQYLTKYKIEKDDLSPQGDTFWGYTDKIVNYKYAEPFDEQKLAFLGTEVSAFGFISGFSSIYAKDYFRDQFDILYYDADGEFVVKLRPANTTDEIILTMLKSRGTFLEMFNKSKELIKKGTDKLKQDAFVYNLNTEDELIIPVIRFKAMHNYSELQGLEFSSNYGPIDAFEQTINFSFDRKGVVLEAEVSMWDSVGAPQKPKLLLFDKPFYLYIKEEKASHPYFNLWVSDTAILEKKEIVATKQ